MNNAFPFRYQFEWSISGFLYQRMGRLMLVQVLWVAGEMLAHVVSMGCGKIASRKGKHVVRVPGQCHLYSLTSAVRRVNTDHKSLRVVVAVMGSKHSPIFKGFIAYCANGKRI